MSISYTYVGVRHFINPDFFLAIMPNYLSFHLEIVYISGIAEILFGILLFFRKTRTFASYGIITLLVCVFPANIHLVGSELSQSILEATKDQTNYKASISSSFYFTCFLAL